MAAYPSVIQSPRSSRESIGFAVFDFAVSGLIRGRAFNTDSPYRFRIVHENVSSSDASSIESHYVANGETTAFSFTWANDSTAYTVFYEGPPQINPGDGAQKHVESILVGNKT